MIVRACTVKAGVNLLSALVAFAAAYWWLRSAQVRVSADGQTKPNERSMIYRDEIGQVDLVATVRESSHWNAWAARAAAIAAALQGIGLLLQD
jgi:putative heme iron utilization protein